MSRSTFGSRPLWSPLTGTVTLQGVNTKKARPIATTRFETSGGAVLRFRSLSPSSFKTHHPPADSSRMADTLAFIMTMTGDGMADKPDESPPAKADEMSAAITELIPSSADNVSALGSADAPFIYTDWIGSHGYNGGVVSFTLEALRYMSVGNKTRRDRVVVAHLRMPLHTLAALKQGIAQIELMLQKPAGTGKN
jgi:hypothetical protein